MLPAGTDSNQGDERVYAVDAAAGQEEEEAKRVASAALLRIMDAYAFHRATVSVVGGSAPASADLRSTPAEPAADAVSGAAAAFLLPAATSDSSILARASVLAEALCMWGHFGLPLESLEAALRPRLGGGDDTRVLTAVFFPQLSPDIRQNGGAIRTDPAVAGDSSGGWRQRQVLSVGPAGQPVASLGPTSSQAVAASGLGLSPVFLFSLTRASGKLAAAAAAAAMATSSAGVGGSGRGSPGVVSTAMTRQRSPFSVPGSLSGRSDGRMAALSTPSPLALLLQHRTGGGGAGGGVLASPIRLAPPTSSIVGGREGGNGGTMTMRGRSAWPEDAKEEKKRSTSRAGATIAAAAAATHSSSSRCADVSEVVWFSCGHHFSREHLVRTVAPSCISSERHSTSSLQRTQQALALEYSRRNAGAACPECATKELGRLVAGLRPSAGAPGVGGGAVAPGVPVPPPLPTPLVPPPRFQTHDRTRAR